MAIFSRRSRIVPVVIIGSICLAWASVRLVGRRRREGEDHGKDEIVSRSMSMGVLRGGKLALHRIVEFHEAKAHGVPDLQCGLSELKTILAQKHPDFNKLQSVVAKLEMSGKEEEAVKVLEEERLEALNDGKWHEVYEIEMLLVEMLIYKGDFQKAFECKCLGDEEISTDARRPLFKAILHLLLEHPKEAAKECWEEFVEIQTQFKMPFSSSEEEDDESDMMSSYDEFQKTVNRLKCDIYEAMKKRKKKP